MRNGREIIMLLKTHTHVCIGGLAIRFKSGQIPRRYLQFAIGPMQSTPPRKRSSEKTLTFF